MTGDDDITGVATGFSEALVVLTAGAYNDSVGCFYRIAGASEPTTVTMTSSGTDENAMIIKEYEGPWNASPLDQTLDEGVGDGVTTYPIASVTTTQADELAICFVYTRDDLNIYSNISWDNDFIYSAAADNVADENTVLKSVHMAHKVLSSQGAVGTTTYTPNASSVVNGGIATFMQEGITITSVSSADAWTDGDTAIPVVGTGFV
jgi:hypothetical protein